MVAAQWFDAALRLMPSTDSDHQIEIRRRLAEALRAAGQLDRSRAVLLEAIELVPAGADPTLVDLTSSCAAVERWLGEDRAAHVRLSRALGHLPDIDSTERATLLIELTIDAVFATTWIARSSRGPRRTPSRNDWVCAR